MINRNDTVFVVIMLHQLDGNSRPNFEVMRVFRNSHSAERFRLETLGRLPSAVVIIQTSVLVTDSPLFNSPMQF